MKNIDNNLFLKTALYEGNFGIEVEEHRVNQYNCHLSQVPHAAGLGTRKGHPFFQTDFAESQEELVTSPHESVSACLDHLHCLQSILQDNLDENDMIWPLSMPPKLNADDLDYLATGFKARPWYQKYLEKMLEKYGPFYGLMSGVHVSYSPSAEILTWYKSEYGYSTQAEANNQMLFKTVQHILGYRWLLTYLFGASPISENIDDTIPEKARQLQPVRSFRSSQYGFNNLDNFKTDYSSINAFTAQLNHFMTTGRLVSLSDFHGPARMKGFETLEELQNKGATFIELRIFDLNPFSNNGIDKLTLNFLHLLIMDSITNPKNWCADSLSKAEITNGNNQ